MRRVTQAKALQRTWSKKQIILSQHTYWPQYDKTPASLPRGDFKSLPDGFLTFAMISTTRIINSTYFSDWQSHNMYCSC